MTVGCGIRHINTKHIYSTTEVFTQENTLVTHEDIKKIHLHIDASIPGLVKWDMWWTKWRWGGFSPSTSVSPTNLYST
jgi:hypothetical protein